MSNNTTKMYYLERNNGTDTLHKADNDPLIKTYSSNSDMETDLANNDDNELIASYDNDYDGITITDKVEENNMDVVTSNAVYKAMKQPMEFPNTTSFTKVYLFGTFGSSGQPTDYSWGSPDSSTNTYTVPSDGYYVISALSYNATGQVADGIKISINGIPVNGFTVGTSYSTYRANSASICLPLYAGDVISITTLNKGIQQILRMN